MPGQDEHMIIYLPPNKYMSKQGKHFSCLVAYKHVRMKARKKKAKEKNIVKRENREKE